MRTWTSLAPASRTRRTIFRLVVPRTMLSSTSTTRLPSRSPAHGIEFQFHAEVADGLHGLNECAADVVVADQAHAKRHAGFERISDGRGHAGIRNGHDDVRRHGMLARQQLAKRLAAVMHAAAEDQAIGARKIDMLEDAVLMRLGRREANGFKARRGRCATFLRVRFRGCKSHPANQTRKFRKRPYRYRPAAQGRADGIRADRGWHKAHRE